MTDKLKELLRDLRKTLEVHRWSWEGDYIERIDEVLAEPAVEAAEIDVVDHLYTPNGDIPLMTVAQHRRILAGVNQQAGSGWIAVSERLPEAAGSYITFSPHGYWPQQVHVWLENEQAWEHEWLGKKKKEVRPKTWITHWQPLPPSPAAKADA